ncbi:hypothetical protein OKW46_001546 [Paraburkholderia sp. WSM4179]|nr:hypothetical protein [Paraburkholderia sp. WSM4179]
MARTLSVKTLEASPIGSTDGATPTLNILRGDKVWSKLSLLN